MNKINQDDIDDLQSFLEAVEPNRGEKDLFKQYQKALKTVHKLRKVSNGQQQKPQPEINNAMKTTKKRPKIELEAFKAALQNVYDIFDPLIEVYGVDNLYDAIYEYDELKDFIYKSRPAEILQESYDASIPKHERSRYVLSEGLRYVSDKGITELHDFATTVIELIECLQGNRTMSKDNLQYISKETKQEAFKLLGSLTSELLNRMSDYREDINRIKKAS